MTTRLIGRSMLRLALLALLALALLYPPGPTNAQASFPPGPTRALLGETYLAIWL